MTTQWIIQTHENPLRAVRQLLRDIWKHAGLQGMLIPMYQPGERYVAPLLARHPQQLLAADPFVPLMSINAARWVSQLAVEYPQHRFGAVLRPCEVRAVSEMVRRGSLHIDNWLIIGTDCLGSFPRADFDWRLKNARAIEGMTREALRFARQGGIAPYRFREACQMCSLPVSQNGDVCIGLLGLPVRQYLLVKVRDEAFADALELNQIPNEPATSAILAQRQRLLDTLSRRRIRTRECKIRALPVGSPHRAEDLVTLIQNCENCHKCLAACPLYSGELDPHRENGQALMDAVYRWLAACVGCGMCEQACPKNLPLTALIGRISREMLTQEMA